MVRVDLVTAKELVDPGRDILIVSPYHSLRVAPGDVGVDLRTRKAELLSVNAPKLIPTGVKVVIPPGIAGFVSRRSGVNGIVVDNSPGLVDPVYRGEVKVIVRLVNKEYAVQSGMVSEAFDGVIMPQLYRFAQLSLVKVVMPLLGDVPFTGQIYYSEDEELYHRLAEIFPTERGEGGFGHTGKY